jgi:ribosomal protein S10
MTVVKSPHVNKKAKDQFEIVFYNRLICFKNCQFKWEFFQDLKKELQEHAIKTSGKKDDLINRLIIYNQTMKLLVDW